MSDNQIMTDSNVMRDQYGSEDRLVARQSLWKSRPGRSLYDTVLDLAALDGTEFIVDVGCGNGAYLAELRRRGHGGPVLGLDLSEGMARVSSVHTRTVVADAQALPLPDGGVDVALSMHMLYHVPDIPRAIAEIRRVVRPGGVALVATNGSGHTAEAKAILAQAARRVAGIDVDGDWDARRFDPDVARDLLAVAFGDVDVHELGDTSPIPDPATVSGYLASWPPESIGLHAGPVWSAVLAAADELIAAHFVINTEFAITSRVAVLICQ